VSDLLLRVAFFPDAYHEVDGIANTARHFEAFAGESGLPFLTVCGGDHDDLAKQGTLTRLVRRKGALGFGLDKKHRFDLAFWRHYDVVKAAVKEFNPDIVHITGPSDVGQLGALIAHRLQVPLAASWHTNLHQYAEQRGVQLFPSLRPPWKAKLGAALREGSLLACLRFYQFAQMLFAPNRELMDLLERGTGKSCRLMERGVDTDLFNPAKRDRTDDALVLGYVGRLSTEKDVRLLTDIERALLGAGLKNFRFLIAGQGSEEPWLRANLQRAGFAGVLRGEALARAYANMDLFIFPSRTDTFGNVVLEALSSGVPAIVTNSGGPQFIVQPGKTGFIARDIAEFVACIQVMAGNPEMLQAMRRASRARALNTSWARVFESVYDSYEHALSTPFAGKKVRTRAIRAVGSMV
jgi:glycosyltransferase involved in cell wall biosynthesis